LTKFRAVATKSSNKTSNRAARDRASDKAERCLALRAAGACVRRWISGAIVPFREKVFWLAIGAMLLIGFAGLIPAHGDICDEVQNGQDAVCHSYQAVPFVGFKIVQSLDKAGVAITAFATIAIALFTFTLKRSTDKLWAAGERQISAVEEANRISQQAIVAGQRAWLSVDGVKFIAPTKIGEDEYILRVEAVVKNVGQTPATSVQVEFESYYAEGNPETFADATNRVIRHARAWPATMGTAIFPDDTLTTRLVWSDPKGKIEKSITTRPDGARKGNLTVFVTVSYLVVGDDKRHVTHHPHGLLNIAMGLELAKGTMWNLPHEPFIAGVID
jgi:hypothetical protein